MAEVLNFGEPKFFDPDVLDVIASSPDISVHEFGDDLDTTILIAVDNPGGTLFWPTAEEIEEEESTEKKEAEDATSDEDKPKVGKYVPTVPGRLMITPHAYLDTLHRASLPDGSAIISPYSKGFLRLVELNPTREIKLTNRAVEEFTVALAGLVTYRQLKVVEAEVA